MIEFQNSARIFSNTRAGVGPIQTRIEAGEWVALLGPSGSGKSTLLRMIAGLEAPSEGKVNHPFKRSDVSYVFQEPALLAWKTVIENVIFPLQLRGGAQSDTQQRSQARLWLEKLKLSGFENAYPNELSGGMKMRVSLARALVGNPKLLLLDEPFAALDEPIRIELGLELRELWKSLKPTVVLVTHSITEAVWLADRIILLQGQPGKIKLDEVLKFGADRPLSLRGQPQFLTTVEKCFELLRS